MPGWADPQKSYFVQTNGVSFNPKLLKEKFDINFENGTGEVVPISQNTYLVTISNSQLENFKRLPNVKSVEPINGPSETSENQETAPSPMLQQMYNQFTHLGANQDIFPNPKNSDQLVFDWSRDNYGPLWLPKKGETIKFTPKNFLKYQRAISAYENHDLKFQNGNYLLDGQPITEYTFEKDYYFMMGDNRHASDDSRYWGFVPEDHIVGKPVFIWMSWDKYADGFNKIRKDRVFTVVHSDGPRKTYFLHVTIVALLLYFGNRYYQQRKKAKEAA